MGIKHSKFYLLFKFISIFLFLFTITILILIPILKIKISDILSLFSNKRFINAIVFGLKTSLIATFLSGVLGIPTGYFLARNKKFFSKIIETVFDIPIIVPPLIIGVFFLILFNTNFVKSFYNFIFTIYGAIIVQFFISFPYTLKAAKSTFEIIPEKYEQIAMTLGASPFRSFFDTTFKLSINGIISGIILSWIRSFGEFGGTLIVGGGIINKTENIPIYIYMTISQGEFYKGISASFVVILLSIIFLVIIKSILTTKKLD